MEQVAHHEKIVADLTRQRQGLGHGVDPRLIGRIVEDAIGQGSQRGSLPNRIVGPFAMRAKRPGCMLPVKTLREPQALARQRQIHGQIGPSAFQAQPSACRRSLTS
jgi:hypothetical protein